MKRSSYMFKNVKDFDTGEILKLTLIKKEEYPHKDYDLYTVCKILENKETEEEQVIPLYNETFTSKQIDEFYNEPTYYVAGLQE